MPSQGSNVHYDRMESLTARFALLFGEKAHSMQDEKKTSTRNPPGKASVPPVSAKSRTTVNMEALEKSLGYTLRRAQLSTFDLFSSTMAQFDVRPSQFAVLVLIRSNPGLTQSSICAALGIQKTNFVALLDKLEDRGLTVRRKVGGDRRSSALHLTLAGETFVATMEAAHDAMEKKLSKRLGAPRTRELLANLKEFAHQVHA
jgi:DNA-binding MarR family transcriptional regulator